MAFGTPALAAYESATIKLQNNTELAMEQISLLKAAKERFDYGRSPKEEDMDLIMKKESFAAEHDIDTLGQRLRNARQQKQKNDSALHRIKIGYSNKLWDVRSRRRAAGFKVLRSSRMTECSATSLPDNMPLSCFEDFVGCWTSSSTFSTGASQSERPLKD
ncbi:MAG: hypothetical protein Q9181_001581 [Wetmoreana brouardii]